MCALRVGLRADGPLLIGQVKPRSVGLYKCVGRGAHGHNVSLEASLLIAGSTHTHMYTHTHTHTFPLLLT